ncbi:peptide/nickel transport system ATP-binding protein [Streptomyces sp. TLI_053]|uniref:dipeptide ABC transporter ATP-binding protein n=1 Tax=Streptomyces sp. TLI_053 TaxID=1855352 RepID=UPI00087B7069|nr:ABC transporter ATP-binding protein [Streptomyces sp. TLI_053]SDT28393.1 peptide/nickel transport system ATP-binding protein [Streptomyces sp. TLI_053]
MTSSSATAPTAAPTAAPVPAAGPPVLSVRDLSVSFADPRGGAPVHAVRGLSFDLARGEVLGLVGESGSGKSATGLAVLGLHDPRTTTVTGSVRLDGQELVGAGERVLRQVRGGRVALVFQDALTSLSPFHTVGAQLAEMYRLHHPRAGRAEAGRAAAAMLDRVGIPAARTADHPHRFSGGMRQRVMIAMALLNNPDVLIADEPTTALDARVQGQVLDLLGELQREHGTAVLLVSHDLGVVAGSTDRTLVLRGGREVETAPTAELLAAPREPYTRALVGAALTLESVPGTPLPTVDDPSPAPRPTDRPGPAASGSASATGGRWLVEVEDLSVHFPGRRRFPGTRSEPVRAVEGLGLRIAPGETLGLVGESGSGKSTTARVLAGLQPATAGTVRYDGQDAGRPDRALRRRLAKEVQLVFQDPYASLNPRRTVAQTLETPLRLHTALGPDERRRRSAELLERVGLPADRLDRYPHEFSGGQRQRIGIARALAAEPRLIIADEPVSALDVSVQAQVLNLLMELREQLGVAFLFVSHDLAVVRHFCDRVAVMHRGRLVESADRDRLFAAPHTEYTRELLAAAR